MKLSHIISALELKCLTKVDGDREVVGAYTSDLLSDVIANCQEGQLWITLQGHQNIIAVALLNDLAGVIITCGYPPNPDTIDRANEKGIALFATDLNSYQVSGKLYELLR